MPCGALDTCKMLLEKLQVDDAVSMAAAAFGKEALSVYLQTGPRAATQPCYSVSCDLKQRKSETGNQQECALCDMKPFTDHTLSASPHEGRGWRRPSSGE